MMAGILPQREGVIVNSSIQAKVVVSPYLENLAMI